MIEKDIQKTDLEFPNTQVERLSLGKRMEFQRRFMQKLIDLGQLSKKDEVAWGLNNGGDGGAISKYIDNKNDNPEIYNLINDEKYDEALDRMLVFWNQRTIDDTQKKAA